MWCDNCLLIFPLGAGAIALGVILALYQFAGGALLFEYGEFFFFHRYEPEIYGGYAMAQGAVAVLAVISFSMRSYSFTRMIFRIYPIILLLGAARAGVMAWSLLKYKSTIIQVCANGGVRPDDNSLDSTPVIIDDSKRLPVAFCNQGVDNFITIFTVALALDFVLMCYFFFLLWRFSVKLFKLWSPML